MNPQTLIFIVLALIAVVSAYRVISAGRIMHAAIWLALLFVAMAGVFLLLGADFLAAAQVLVYAGAITTLIVFGIMLSGANEVAGPAVSRSPQRSEMLSRSEARGGPLSLVAAIAFSVVMLIVFGRMRSTPEPGEAVADTVKAIGDSLFTRYVIPFEVVSLVLLVALIGAIVLSIREEGGS